MSNLMSRVEKLERAMQPNQTVVVWRAHSETDEQAIARWHEGHPDTPVRDTNMLLVGWEAPQ